MENKLLEKLLSTRYIAEQCACHDRKRSVHEQQALQPAPHLTPIKDD
jgi:hypothetical protein